MIISLAVNRLFYRKGRKGKLLNSYLMLQGALLLWIVSKIFKTVSPNIELRWLFIVTQYLGVSFLGPLFLNFAWLYRFEKPLPRRILRSLYLLSLVFFLFIAANPLHHLFYATYNFRRDTFGPAYYVFIPATYLQIVTGTMLCFQRVFRRGLSLGDLSIGLAAAVPLAINIGYSFRLIKPLFDITPIVMTSSLIFFGFAALRSHFLGLLPVARSALLETLTDPMVLTSRRGKVLWSRGLLPGDRPGETIHRNGRIYRESFRAEGPRDIFIRYTDISDLENFRRDLERKTGLLEESNRIIKARNREKLELMEEALLDRSRRDLHDILGHSLTMGIFLFRRAQKQPEEEAALRLSFRRHLDEACRGLRDRLSRTNTGTLEDESVLSIALQSLIAGQEGTPAEIRLHRSGLEFPLDCRFVSQLVQCCREAVTNGVKHGRAEHVDISLLYRRDSLVMVITDDGIGCSRIEYGNGLSLMAKSLEEFGASLRAWSEAGQGFQLTIRLDAPPSPAG